MADYTIRVDSSTKPNKDGFLTGKSAVAWTTHTKNNLINAGVLYFSYNGPNKSMYEGILAALSQLESEHFYSGGVDNVIVKIDCEPVLRQLLGTRGVLKMKNHKARINKFQMEHPNVTFEFVHENESVSEYKKVDQMSKVGRDWIQRMAK